MIAKSILAGVILATAAGAFVYFDGNYSTEETSSSTTTEDVTLRAPSIIEDDRVDVAGADGMRNESSENTPVSAPQTTYEDADIAVADEDDDTRDAPFVDNGLAPTDADGREMGEKNIDISVEREDKSLSVTVIAEPYDGAMRGAASNSLIDRVMAETLKISVPDLRDRAYLDIVSYALKNEDFRAASNALQKIEQVELRDTARNRIAITHALNNDADRAFAIIEELEVDALRDVIRLQVIEALITPEQLPQELR